MAGAVFNTMPYALCLLSTQGPSPMPTPPANKHPTNEASVSPPLPWYKDGLRFECTSCGDCCTGEPGYVWVNKAEITAMANLLGTSAESFEAQYVRIIGIRRSLVELPNGDCIFFDSKTRHCVIYQVRPRQCRSWPFWKSNLRTPQTWGDVCNNCPGSGRGKLHSLESIQKEADLIRV